MSKKRVPIVAIVGRANVGKSSLFNAVLRRREAIVADEPGTTRDSITAKASFNGQDFWLVDTAGLKDAKDDFEFTIQEQIIQAADSADVIIVMMDATAVVSDEDRKVAKLALKTKKPVLLSLNKIDKVKTPDIALAQKLGIKTIIPTSTTQHTGIAELFEAVTELIPEAKINIDDNRIRVALLGRPNVGKSFLFNTLVKKQQAIVADRAGTTRDINRQLVRYMEREIEIMDTAGIRRSGKIEKGVERFSVIRSLAAIEQSDVCLLLMDANELGVGLDQKIAGLIKEAGKGLVLVVSKWDSLDKDAYTRDAIAPKIKANYEFAPWAPLIFTSAQTGQNVTKLFDLVLDITNERSKRIKTSELNHWLRKVTLRLPPVAAHSTLYPRLRYMVQETDTLPPTFQIHGSHTKAIHWSYKRHLEKELREAFGFIGTPVGLWFIDRDPEKPFAKKDKRTTKDTDNRY